MIWRRRLKPTNKLPEREAVVTLTPEVTGLPMAIFASRYDNQGRRPLAHIRVHRRHGAAANPATSNTARVVLRPVPHPDHSELSERDAARVYAWATINQTALVAYWEGRISAVELMDRLMPLPPLGRRR